MSSQGGVEAKVDLKHARQILLVGGSFDPPHVAHGVLPRLAAQVIGADVIAYIPTGRQPQKQGIRQTEPSHRLAMLRLMLEDHVRDQPDDAIPATILTLEIERMADGLPSYTVHTLEALRARWGGASATLPRLRWLMGGDQAANFHTWHQPGRIEVLAEPVVVLRPPWTAESLLARIVQAQGDEAAMRWRPRLIADAPVMDVSSTDIRLRVAQDRPITGLVSPLVEAYIHDHGLYGP